ncbi:hypothetical protein [Aquipuribacter hungaricus]|uniref:Uncharacterized protein n=1 Tax=Aquipuribacter hungaricus TaxID=545624 RepID=A0ABV7WFE1_9MICO
MTRTTSPSVGAPVGTVVMTLALVGTFALAGCSGDGDVQVPRAEPASSTSPAAPEASVEPDKGATPPTDPPATEATVSAAAAAPSGTAASPSGTVPDGWQLVDDGSGPVYALPPGFATQAMGEVTDGVGVTVHGLQDGSLVVTDSRLSGAQFDGARPEDILAGGIAGAAGGGGLTPEDREDFTVDGRPAAGFRAPDPTGGGRYLAVRLLVDGDAVISFISTQADEETAAAALEQVWDTLRLP